MALPLLEFPIYELSQCTQCPNEPRSPLLYDHKFDLIYCQWNAREPGAVHNQVFLLFLYEQLRRSYTLPWFEAEDAENYSTFQVAVTQA